MLFIFLALAGQFLNAIVALIDKYLVVSPKSALKPLVYVFYVGVLSGFVVVFLPFGLISTPDLRIVLMSLAAAATFIPSLWFLYRALASFDASDVMPAMGSVSAIATFAFSVLILGDVLGNNFLISFLFLVAGTSLMSYFRFKQKSFLQIVIAGVLFGLSSVILKLIFSEVSFWDGFFWSRIANVAVAGLIFLAPGFRDSLKDSFRGSSRKTKVVVIGNKALAGIAFFMILTAVNLGSVSIVNALIGAQFVFILIFALMTHKFQGFLYESRDKKSISHKILATALIIAGLAVLFL